MKRRKERETEKAAKTTGSEGVGMLSSVGTTQERLDRISHRIAAEKSGANFQIKEPKVFETVPERLKRLNEARAMRKLQSTGAV